MARLSAADKRLLAIVFDSAIRNEEHLIEGLSADDATTVLIQQMEALRDKMGIERLLSMQEEFAHLPAVPVTRPTD